MLQRNRLTTVLTLAAALAAPSLFGDDRHDDRTYRGSAFDRRPVHRNVTQRHVTLEGRIRDIDRDRNGFVIRLDSGHRLFAPTNAQVRLASRRGYGRVRSLDRGDVIRVSGPMRSRSLIYAQSIYLVRDARARYDDSYFRGSNTSRTLTGIVESVDHYDGTFRLRDSRGQLIEVEVHRDHEFAQLRRGDRVALRGAWHDNHFVALDIDRQGFGW